ncbi:MAG: hypothetical protein JXD22_00910 [Sedimentisphaerales bacterium]|nr:hypothetical protein [Sedimentisphaerales bacterium]
MMKKGYVFRLMLVLAGAVLVLWSATDCPGQDKVELKLAVPKGFSATIVKTEESVSTRGAEQKNELKRKMVSEFSVECLAVEPNGVMHIKQTLTRMKAEGGWQQSKFEYDSAKKDAVVPKAIRKEAAYLGEALVMRVSPDGSVIEVQGIGKVVDKIFVDPKQPENSKMKLWYKKLRPRLIKEYQKSDQMLCLGLLESYPGREVGVGEQWASENEGGITNLGRVKNIWSIKNIETAGVVVEKKAVRKVDNQMPQWTQLEGLTAHAQGAGKEEAQLLLDRATGFVSKGQSVREYKGKITLKDSKSGEIKKEAASATKVTCNWELKK